MKPKTKIKYQHLLTALTIIILSGIYFNKNYINEFPSHINSNNYEFGLYIWNTGKNHLYIDDITLKLY
ncbi:MAG: hypothetical protein K9G70_01575 [Prolixibacteraceae bacterium]|nr:hypothetical protein [Prolixibacteraceae bacterium]